MKTTFRYLIAAAALVSTASLVDAQARGRMGPPVNGANTATALTEAQRTQLRELREKQRDEQRALQEKHREALAKIAPEQARRVAQMRDQRDRRDRQRRVQAVQQRRGPQMAPPPGRGPAQGFVPPGQLRRQGPPRVVDPRYGQGQPPRGGDPRYNQGQPPRGQQMQPGRMVLPPQLGRGPTGPVIQGRPLPPARGGDQMRRGDDRGQRGPVRRPPPPPPRDRR